MEIELKVGAIKVRLDGTPEELLEVAGGIKGILDEPDDEPDDEPNEDEDGVVEGHTVEVGGVEIELDDDVRFRVNFYGAFGSTDKAIKVLRDLDAPDHIIRLVEDDEPGVILVTTDPIVAGLLVTALTIAGATVDMDRTTEAELESDNEPDDEPTVLHAA